MRVFLSWSGDLSEAVAKSLTEWLPLILSAAKPWMSKHNIQAGADWEKELSNNLNNTDSAILLLTKANQNAPWVLFEAGVLSKTTNKQKVIPYCLDLPLQDVAEPLKRFQAVNADKNGTFKLIESLNTALPDPLPIERVTKLFNTFWPQLELTISDLVRKINRPQPKNIAGVLDVEINSLNTRIDTLEDYEQDGGGASTLPWWDSYIDGHKKIKALYKEALKLIEKANQIPLNSP